MEVDFETGSLSQVASLAVPDPFFVTINSTQLAVRYALAAEPRGRFVHMAIGRQLVSFALDARTGQLSERSRALVDPEHVYTYAIAASERQVHGVFEVGHSYVSHVKWIAFQADATGALSGRACFIACDLALPDRGQYGPGVVVPDGPGRFVESNFGENLVTSVVQVDGSLVDVGRTSLSIDPELVASGPGFIASSDGLSLQTVAVDWTTGATSPGALLHGILGADASVSGLAVASTGLIAIVGRQGLDPEGPSHLETWRRDSSGMLQRSGALLLTKSLGRYVAFDPSSRFLYVTGPGVGIDALAIAPDGSLGVLARYPWGSGPIVMIAP